MRDPAAMVRYLAALAFTLVAAPAVAEAPFDFPTDASPVTAELPPYLQCVPFARQVSGIQIYGDAWTWWDQAAARYARGRAPRVGAVMAFRPHGNMTLGHVAAVTGVVDARTVLLSHANWSPISGRRGQIERNVRAVDVSPANDWSQVRVWYAPISDLGTTAWPVEGFIYPAAAAVPRFTQAALRSGPAPAPRLTQAVARSFEPMVSRLTQAPARTLAPPRTDPPARAKTRDVIGEIIRAAG